MEWEQASPFNAGSAYRQPPQGVTGYVTVSGVGPQRPQRLMQRDEVVDASRSSKVQGRSFTVSKTALLSLTLSGACLEILNTRQFIFVD